MKTRDDSTGNRIFFSKLKKRAIKAGISPLKQFQLEGLLSIIDTDWRQVRFAPDYINRNDISWSEQRKLLTESLKDFDVVDQQFLVFEFGEFDELWDREATNFDSPTIVTALWLADQELNPFWLQPRFIYDREKPTPDPIWPDDRRFQRVKFLVVPYVGNPVLSLDLCAGYFLEEREPDLTAYFYWPYETVVKAKNSLACEILDILVYPHSETSLTESVKEATLANLLLFQFLNSILIANGREERWFKDSPFRPEVKAPLFYKVRVWIRRLFWKLFAK